MEKFKGDTFIFQLSIKQENGEDYIFKSGDIIKCGMKKNIGDTKYILEKEISVVDSEKEVEIIFESSETKDIKEGEYILEFTLISQRIVNTVYQKAIKIRGVVNE